MTTENTITKQHIEKSLSEFSHKLFQINTQIIIPYNIINDLGYISNFFCFLFEINDITYSKKGIIEFLMKEKSVDCSEESLINSLKNKSEKELQKYISEKLKYRIKKVKVKKISKLFEISTDTDRHCDFLRPNLLIGSLFEYSKHYNNNNPFVSWEIGKIFIKNNIGKRCEKNRLSIFIYYYDDKKECIELAKQILSSIFDYYYLSEIKNAEPQQWKIMYDSKHIGVITDRFDIDCNYFNRVYGKKMIIKTKPKNNEFIEIYLKKDSNKFSSEEKISIQKTIDLMNEDEKTIFIKSISENYYYSIYCDSTKQIYLLKKDMIEIKKLKMSENKFVNKVPCIFSIDIDIDKLNL